MIWPLLLIGISEIALPLDPLERRLHGASAYPKNILLFASSELVQNLDDNFLYIDPEMVS